MRILAIDSSGIVATVAIVSEETVLAEYTINHKKTHSQTLLPMIEEITGMIELDIKQIDAIAVSGGPGSFTGLRIGSSTAKGLGQALNIPLINVPTLEGLAYNLYQVTDLVCPIMDAKRNQVYTGIYEFNNYNMQNVLSQRAVSIDEIIVEINNIGKSIIFVGDGVGVFKEVINEKLKVNYSFAPPHLNRQRAAAVGALGLIYYRDNKIENPSEHKPEYLRLSQAERELAQKQKNLETT